MKSCSKDYLADKFKNSKLKMKILLRNYRNFKRNMMTPRKDILNLRPTLTKLNKT